MHVCSHAWKRTSAGVLWMGVVRRHERTAREIFIPTTFFSLAHAHVIILRDEIITMQNNRCIGPIHAMAERSKRCARNSHGVSMVGSKPIRGFFGNIFIELFCFVLLYK